MSRQKDDEQFYLDMCYRCTEYVDEETWEPESSCDNCPVLAIRLKHASTRAKHFQSNEEVDE